MAELIVTDDQAQILRTAGQVIFVRDVKGNVVGRAFPVSEANPPADFSPEEIAEAKRIARSNGPWFTTQEVLDRLGQQEI